MLQTRAAGGTAPQPPAEPSLPAKFTEVRSILEEAVIPGRLVSVIGVVKDYQLPILTGGKDHKSTLSLYDLSTEDEQYGLKIVIFRPECDMPQVTVGDVIIVESAKVQRFQANPLSLITNWNTSIRVYKASKIPQPPQTAKDALAAGSRQDKYAPGPAEHAYASYLYHKICKYSLPDEQEFKEKVAQSLNVKKKFCLLKDVAEGRFCDLVVRVATEPYMDSDPVTLYVSDYTENPHFHPQMWQRPSEAGSGAGDPYGYTSGSPAPSGPKKEWVGPYGKRTLQITCYEPHATVIREEVSAGLWLALRNVQIKFGRDGKFLEGFMREDRNLKSARTNIFVLETKVADGETVDPNLKEAIRRCRDYERKKKKQLKEIGDAHAAGLKRKASGSVDQKEPPLNSKARRKLKRKAATGQEKETVIQDPVIQEYVSQAKAIQEKVIQEKVTQEQAIHEEPRHELNDQIRCEAHDAPFINIKTILKPTLYETTVNGQSAGVSLPFTNAKFLARVRVVDYFPRNLEDFAHSRRLSEYDILSDHEDDSDDSSSASSNHDESQDSSGVGRVWEWSFALQLEDLNLQQQQQQQQSKSAQNKNNTRERARLWVFVGNNEGQCLTGLDAANLRTDSDLLSQLRERMSVLWGNLEEVKTRAPVQNSAKKEAVGQGKPRRGKKNQLEKPPLESDAEADEGEGTEKVEPVSNQPFSCCIQQYGVYDKEKEEWVRCFGLFGTRIRM